MAIGTFSTHTLAGVVQTLRPPRSFWLDTCFPNIITFETEDINFDVVAEGMELAPFVSPMASSKPIKSRGYDTKTFRPAYVKMKHVIDATQPIKRRPGEAYTGTLSLEARKNAIVAQNLQDQLNRHTRTREWMACQAILNGKVVVAGEDYPSVEVDFGRKASFTKTLTTTAKWDDAASKPTEQLEDWSDEMQQEAAVSPSIVVMGVNAWKLFRAKTDVKDLLNNEMRNSNAILDYEPNNGEVVRRVGATNRFEFWVYNDYYRDASGNVVKFINTNDVILMSPQALQGTRCFGAIRDLDNMVATDLFAKTWRQEEPSVEFLLTQSAPLMVPVVPNASMRIRVA